MPENAVTLLYADLEGDDWVDRHWERFVARHAEDVVVESRSSEGERYRMVGRDETTQEAKSLYDVGLRRLTVTPIAVRGDQLALIRFTNFAESTEDGGGPAVVEQVCVCQTNAQGLISLVVIFEDADMELALRELDVLAGGPR